MRTHPGMIRSLPGIFHHLLFITDMCILVLFCPAFTGSFAVFPFFSTMKRTLIIPLGWLNRTRLTFTPLVAIQAGVVILEPFGQAMMGGSMHWMKMMVPSFGPGIPVDDVSGPDVRVILREFLEEFPEDQPFLGPFFDDGDFLALREV